MNKHLFLKGAFFLILASFLSRFIGFFYRIYLSNVIGSKNLGVYQLIFPIYSICYTIYASGIQTAISKDVAARLNNKDKHLIITPFLKGISLSLLLSLILSSCLYYFAPFISTNILKESACSSSLRVLSFVFPFCGTSACINGFYYSLKKTSVPSISQLFEQIIRVGTVYIYCSILHIKPESCIIAVIGLVIGECLSSIFMIICIFSDRSFTSCFERHTPFIKYDSTYSYKDLIMYTYPLTLTKLLVSILNSAEAILIPIMLTAYGHSRNESLSIYGILTGMSMSFILFPSAITNSIAVILLPVISQAQASNNDKDIKHTVSNTIHYTTIIGLISLSVFVYWGNSIGLCVFHNHLSGSFLEILAWLCPFIYITTTLSSILNGLGKTTITFRNSLITSIIKILFVLIAIPRLSIYGYLLGILCSSIILLFLDLYYTHKLVSFDFNVIKSIIKPAILIIFTGFILHRIYNFIIVNYSFPTIIILFSTCFFHVLLCMLLLLKYGIISLKLK